MKSLVFILTIILLLPALCFAVPPVANLPTPDVVIEPGVLVQAPGVTVRSSQYAVPRIADDPAYGFARAVPGQPFHESVVSVQSPSVTVRVGPLAAPVYAAAPVLVPRRVLVPQRVLVPRTVLVPGVVLQPVVPVVRPHVWWPGRYLLFGVPRRYQLVQ